MGIWDITKRIIQGKPGFEVPPDHDDWSDNDEPTTDFAEDRQAKKAESSQANLVDRNGNKRIPIATIHRVRSITSGANLEIWMILKNESDRNLFLDKITLLGTKFELDYPLKPRGEREFRAYRGALLTHDNYKTAELYYRDEVSGDYFRADHLLEYSYEPDGTYELVDTKIITPIRDV
ncbi:MAG: hypothetical protein ABIR46_04525 [Candidatus Saccharimonadales bacterium]